MYNSNNLLIVTHYALQRERKREKCQTIIKTLWCAMYVHAAYFFVSLWNIRTKYSVVEHNTHIMINENPMDYTTIIWPGLGLNSSSGLNNLGHGKNSERMDCINTYTARPVCWREWISWQYCSSKPLCSGMGEVVLARTSPTLHPPSPRTVLSLSCFKVSQCINCRDWHFKG